MEFLQLDYLYKYIFFCGFELYTFIFMLDNFIESHRDSHTFKYSIPSLPFIESTFVGYVFTRLKE
jgi:hypothetical protein